MLKLTAAVVALALAGSASAAGWRSLTVDASSDRAFEKSLAAFKDKLSPAREYVFGQALKDIWREGVERAKAEERDYTASDYYRQLDGLGYKEIVALTDPTGDTAKNRYRTASLANVGPRAPRGQFPGPNAGVATFSGSQVLDAGQSARAEGRIGGNRW